VWAAVDELCATTGSYRLRPILNDHLVVCPCVFLRGGPGTVLVDQAQPGHQPVHRAAIPPYGVASMLPPTS
jgi:hypothetical protein